jgi:hypothetical protein
VKVKTIATVGLLAFVIASVVFLADKELNRDAGRSVPASPVSLARDKVVAYYLHGRFRCASCLRIESLSGKAIVAGFPKELRSGRLEFRKVNVEEAGNRHFIGDFRLVSQSLVVVEYRDGRQVRWRNLEKVWELMGSERKFLPYVQGGVSDFLKGA